MPPDRCATTVAAQHLSRIANVIGGATAVVASKFVLIQFYRRTVVEASARPRFIRDTYSATSMAAAWISQALAALRPARRP